MCSLAARSDVTCKRTGYRSRGGAATRVDARLASGADELEQRVCRQRSDDRSA